MMNKNFFVFTILSYFVSKTAATSGEHVRKLSDSSSSSLPVVDLCAYFINDINSYHPYSQESQSPEFICSEIDVELDDEKSRKCCSYKARKDILNGEGGGFRVQYSYPLLRNYQPPDMDHAACYAYVDALEDTLCSPYQGKYIQNKTFRICQESCDAVYNNCIPNNIVKDQFATDGPSFCQNAWSDPCDEFPDGYPCKAGIKIEVVSSNTDCMRMDRPPLEMIEFYSKHSEEVDFCAIKVKVHWYWIALIIFLAVTCFVLSFLQYDEGNLHGTSIIVAICTCLILFVVVVAKEDNSIVYF